MSKDTWKFWLILAELLQMLTVWNKFIIIIILQVKTSYFAVVCIFIKGKELVFRLIILKALEKLQCNVNVCIQSCKNEIGEESLERENIYVI